MFEELVFRSMVEQYLHVIVKNFKPTPGFGKKYKMFFPQEAVKHPAKANTNLLEFLVKHYTKLGDIILDPMAGTGSTCVVAVLHGRNAVCIDIEEKFYEWMLGAKERVEKSKTLSPKGRMVVLRGDARRLSELLEKHRNEIDAIITSPPYGEIISKRAGGQHLNIKRVGVSTITARKYSDNDDNIGNLQYGNIDAIITSPPYANTFSDWDVTAKKIIGYRLYYSDERDRSKNNIANIPYYSNDLDSKRSPKPGRGKPTYLGEMLKVYRECYKVLKPGGLILVIVKPFIRNKKVIDLPYHTLLLLFQAGFTPLEAIKYELRTMSFWRAIYYKKYPDVPRIKHEYVLVAEKPPQTIPRIIKP